MSRKRFSVEQIINHLREAEVLLSQGRTVGEICRRIGVSEQSYYRWRRDPPPRLVPLTSLDW